MRRAALHAVLLALAGVAVSLGGWAAAGRLDAPTWSQLARALEHQPVVRARAPRDLGPPLSPDLLVVDGRPADAHRRARPAGSLSVPYAARHDRVPVLPARDGVPQVLVVGRGDDRVRTRELALGLARLWGLEAVTVLDGGWPAWRAAGLPIEGAGDPAGGAETER